MDNQKGIAIIIAMFAAILVMLAGKSCADNMNKNRNTRSGGKAASSAVNNLVTSQNGTTANGSGVYEYTVTAESNVQVNGIEYVTDILGRVIGTVEPTSGQMTETTAEPQVEYVTDILGRVVSVIEPETVETTSEKTTYNNILDEYRSQHPELTKPTKEKDIEEEHYTAPSSLYINIG